MAHDELACSEARRTPRGGGKITRACRTTTTAAQAVCQTLLAAGCAALLRSQVEPALASQLAGLGWHC